MNIFVLDKDPEKAAQYHCDKHVVKMVLETAQLLSTAVQLKNIHLINELYKPTHINHPCAQWARYSLKNFQWLSRLGMALCDEYTFRYNKTHKSQKIIYASLSWAFLFPKNQFIPPPLCMPEEYKLGPPHNMKATVSAYKRYYCGEKASFAKWEKGRKAPDWWEVS